jgi:hypothetical protein
MNAVVTFMDWFAVAVLAVVCAGAALANSYGGVLHDNLCPLWPCFICSLEPWRRIRCVMLRVILIVVALAFTLRAFTIYATEAQYVSCTNKDTAATCAPPASLPPRFFYAEQGPPFDVALRFGGTRPTCCNDVWWIWLKASPSSRPCNAAEFKADVGVGACGKKIGEEILQSHRFKPPPVKR